MVDDESLVVAFFFFFPILFLFGGFCPGARHLHTHSLQSTQSITQGWRYCWWSGPSDRIMSRGFTSNVLLIKSVFSCQGRKPHTLHGLDKTVQCVESTVIGLSGCTLVSKVRTDYFHLRKKKSAS